MSTTAVVVLTALARDEFERDWHGFEEPFQFIEGDGDELQPVETFTATIGDKTVSLPARDVADVVLQYLRDARDEVEEEVEDDDCADLVKAWSITLWPTDEDMDEEARQRVWRRWNDRLEGVEEFATVLDARLHYLVEGYKEMVADFTMIGERMPQLKPVLAEKLQDAHDTLMRLVEGIAGA